MLQNPEKLKLVDLDSEVFGLDLGLDTSYLNLVL